MKVLQSTLKHGIRIPQDLSVIGFDNHSCSVLTSPPLTTIKQDAFTMGSKCLESLDLAIRDNSKDRAQEVLIPLQLIIRESTGACLNTITSL